MSFDDSQVRVAIIGAGIAGLSTAIAFRRQYNGFNNFIIFERASDIGGTWRENTYPGCSSDVAGHFYCLSTDMNPYWNTFYIKRAEIQSYWRNLMYKYSIQDNIVYSSTVETIQWDERFQVYYITTLNTETGKISQTTADIVISGMGSLSTPVFPKGIPGWDSFKGPFFHSAQWRQDVPLQGKRVGVVGNGCSAAQLVAEVAKDPSTKIINFARTKNWFVPRPQFSYSFRAKWIFAHVPFAMRLYRIYLAAGYDLNFLPFRNDFIFKGWNKPLQRSLRKQLTNYITSMVPSKYKDVIVPDYDPGCKRMIFDTGYLECLHQPNVELTFDEIDRVTADGIVKKTGEHVPLDVIVYATGFDTQHPCLNLVGRNGLTIQDYFEEEGGPTAYLGTVIPNFPNFFLLMGPNTVTGHTSVIFSEEVQINYAMQAIKPIMNGHIKSLEPRKSVTHKYNNWIQRSMSRTVWTNCKSWYRADADGKNTAIFPGPMALFWWYLAWPRWNDFDVVGERNWRLLHRLQTFGWMTALLALGATVGGYMESKWFKSAVDNGLAQVAAHLHH